MALPQEIYYPITLPIYKTGSAGGATWGGHSTYTLNSATTDGLAICFFGDGTAIDKVRVRVRSGSQAGTLNAEIQGYVGTADLPNQSGLPDGTAITNGTATGASITGGVDEVLELSFSTNPTPTGKHWLVITATSGGTVDVDIAYIPDWIVPERSTWRRPSNKYYDGSDWNNTAAAGSVAVQLLDASGNIPLCWARSALAFPYLDGTTPIETKNPAATVAHGVQWTVKQNLTNLIGVSVVAIQLGADDNQEMVVAKDDGTVLGRSSTYNYESLFQSGNRGTTFIFDSPVSLTAGDTVRLAFYDPDGNSVLALGVIPLSAAGDQATYFGLDSGELSYCSATDPAERGQGGSGSWSTDDTELPCMQLIFEEDVSAITGGGGGEKTSIFYN